MASWCRKCLYLLPRLRKLGLQFPNVYLCSVDVNKVARLPKQFEITKMPTFIFFRGDRQVGTLIGGASPQNVATQLQSAVEKYAAQ